MFVKKNLNLPFLKISKKGTCFFWYLLAFSISLFLFFSLSALHHEPWDAPLVYSGNDGVLTLAFVHGLIQGEWYPPFPIHTDRLAAPFGFNMADFPTADHFIYMIMKVISWFGTNSAITYKIYFILIFPLTTVCTVFALRHFRVRFPVAIAIGSLFAHLPFPYERFTHIHLASYFLLPFHAMILIWIWSKKPLFFSYEENKLKFKIKNYKSWLAATVLFLTGMSGVYYAFFFCAFATVAGIYASYDRKSLRHMFSSWIAISFVFFSLCICYLPTMTYHLKNGSNRFVGQRYPSESIFYSTSLLSMIYPKKDLRWKTMADLGARYDFGDNSTDGSSWFIGLVGLIGFLINIFFSFAKNSRNQKGRAVSSKLGILTLFAVLLGTYGGLGAIFSLLVSPSIRCYNRIIIEIACFSLFGFAFFINHLLRNKSSLFAAACAFVIIPIGINSQIQRYPRQFHLSLTGYISNENYIHQIESTMKPNSMILQIPDPTFPEAVPLHRLFSYDPLLPYIHSKTLRWSYGTMQGRPESDFIQKLTQMPLDIEKIQKAGFTGIYVDTNGYKDRGQSVLAYLEKKLKQTPLENSGKDLYFFKLD